MSSGQCFILTTPFGGSPLPCEKITQFNLTAYGLNNTLLPYIWGGSAASSGNQTNLLPVGPDVTPPTIVSIVVSNGSPTVVSLNMSEAMNVSFVPATSAFTITGHTVSSVAYSGSTVLNVTVSSPFVNGEVRTLNYVSAAGGAQDLAGNLLATISGVAITNNVLPAAPVAPGAVTAVTAGTATSTTQPLTWTAPSTGTTPFTYNIGYRLTSAGGAYTSAATGVSTASYTVTGLTASTAYDYQVTATNTAGTGAAGLLGNVSTAAGTPVAPGAVTAVTAGTATSTTQPLLWTAPSTGTTPFTYNIGYRLTSAGGAYTTAVTGLSGTIYTVTGLTASTAYDYQVTATNTAGTGAAGLLNNQSTAAAAPVAPGIVATVTAGTATSTTQPLTWTTPTTGTTPFTYNVGRRLTSAGGAYTIVTGISGNTYTVTGLTASTAYDYQVTATNSAGTGGAGLLGNVATAASAPVAPGAVTAVTAGTATSTTQPLTWTAPSTGTTPFTYNIGYRLTSAGGAYTSAATGVSTASYTVTGLTASTAYDYQVTATNTAGTGAAGLLGNVSTAATGVNTSPLYGSGVAAAYQPGNAQALISSMSLVTGGTPGGHAGNFSVNVPAGQYGWVAVSAANSASGVTFFDGVGNGGWSGAGLPGNNTGASPALSQSTVTFTDSSGVTWRLFRMDYIGPFTGASFTMS